jgi:hypothetical protein
MVELRVSLQEWDVHQKMLSIRGANSRELCVSNGWLYYPGDIQLCRVRGTMSQPVQSPHGTIPPLLFVSRCVDAN